MATDEDSPYPAIAVIRHELDQLCTLRTAGEFTDFDRVRYVQLTQRETELIAS